VEVAEALKKFIIESVKSTCLKIGQSETLSEYESDSCRVKGHIYEFKDWQGGETLSNGDLRVTVTLKDLTAGKMITKLGTAHLIGDFGSLCIDNLEGCSPVFINVSGHSKQARVKKHGNGNYVEYCLEDI
jgi:hypothetical protein